MRPAPQPENLATLLPNDLPPAPGAGPGLVVVRVGAGAVEV